MSGQLLIVDDEQEIRDMLSRHFRLAGYKTQVAENGLEALEILGKSRTDVVISDVVMPELDGVSLLKEIRDHYPMIHTIMITGYMTLDNALASMRYGADTLVFKPLLDLKELDEAVERALQDLERWQEKLHTLQGKKKRHLAQ